MDKLSVRLTPGSQMLKEFNCFRCGIRSSREANDANKTLKKGGNLYCSKKCSNTGRVCSTSHREKVSISLKKHYGTFLKPPPEPKPKRKGRSKEEKAKYYRELMIARYRERRAKAVQDLRGKCVRCGSVKELQLDHIDSTAKEYSIFKTWLSEEKFKAEVAKCQLLCQECHTDKTLADLGRKKAKGTHGTISSYRYCHCDECKAAKNKASREYKARKRQEKLAVSIKVMGEILTLDEAGSIPVPPTTPKSSNG